VKLGWLDWLLLLTVSVLTYEKLSWSTPAVTLTWTNLLATAFVIAFLIDRVRRRDALLHPAAITLAGFMAAFAAVYLAGYFDLTDKAALQFWLKGLGAWGIHFAYLILAVAHLVRRGQVLYIRAIYAFTAGMVVNCVYGILQLGLQIAAGINLDSVVVGRLTSGQGGVGGINVYGTVSGSQHVYRINALTGDPNHLGVMLCVPLMLLLPYYLGDRRGRRRIGLVLLFMFAVQVLTLSRSGALGDAAGIVVLLPQLRRFLPSARTLAIGTAAVLGGFALVYTSSHFVRAVVASHTQLSVGGTQTLRADVRVIAATNKNLEQLVREGKFRDDLYFRLNVVRITMPPLRSRKEDIPLLVRSFLRHFSRANEKPLLDITTDAMNTLLAYDWPGNVRELRTAIEHGVVMTSGPKVTVRDLPRAIRESAGNASGASTVAEKVNPLDLAETEKRLITQALASTGGNITAAANQLGISRRTLHRKLNEMNAQGRNVREQARGAKKRTK